jgi:hypothetical protein
MLENVGQKIHGAGDWVDCLAPELASDTLNTVSPIPDPLAFLPFACTLVHEQTSCTVCALRTKLYQKACFLPIFPTPKIRG